ncbi:MAG: TetR/AcrR family transcriptional regulator [Thermincola sp.]|jgi:AcrR family transcriptional regulator|nr:TetR/AcrR family transcriptional regulator [Thermincola sp.]MDT3702548.1 TetR/AcrR family transcriptional regulator [Thermincola sp.]
MTQKTRFERKKAATKEKIFNTAIDLFLQKGYEETTVDEIVEKADVAKGTFFNHFPTKDALLSYLGQQRVAILGDLLEKEFGKVSSSKEQIFTWLRVYGRINEENKEITALISREIFKTFFYGGEAEKQNILQLSGLLAEIIKKGQQQGEFRQDFSPKKGADLFIGMYFFTLFQWLEREKNYSLVDELIEKAEILMAGMY